MTEIWKAVPGYEGAYEVSDLGRVRSLPRVIAGVHGPSRAPGVLLRPAANNKGYLYVNLYAHARCARKLVHRLVLETFVGPAPEGYEGAHKDGQRTTNSLHNLCWKTPADNQADRIAHQTSNQGERHPLAKLSEREVKDIRSRSVLARHVDIAVEFGVTPETIRDIRRRVSWRHV